MYIKVYFNKKPLFLCDDLETSLQPFLHHDDTIFIDELDSHTVKTMIHEMQEEPVHAGIFFHRDLEELKKEFFKKFSLVKAAGGFVLNPQNEVLLIFRRGRWDLPKGKYEKDETPEACAVRETEEETGVKNLQIVTPLLTTHHTYHEGSRFILKETSWFKMKCKGEQVLIPQVSEDISQLKWVSGDDIGNYKDKTYPSVVDVLDAGFSDSN